MVVDFDTTDETFRRLEQEAEALDAEAAQHARRGRVALAAICRQLAKSKRREAEMMAGGLVVTA